MPEHPLDTLMEHIDNGDLADAVGFLASHPAPIATYLTARVMDAYFGEGNGRTAQDFLEALEAQDGVTNNYI